MRVGASTASCSWATFLGPPCVAATPPSLGPPSRHVRLPPSCAPCQLRTRSLRFAHHPTATPERIPPRRLAAGEPPAPHDDAQPLRLEVLLFCEYGPEVDFAPLPSNRSAWDALTWADGYGFGPPLASNYVWMRS